MKQRSISTVAVALVGLIALASPPRAASGQRAAMVDRSIGAAVVVVSFQTVFAGVGPDGESRVWEGTASGAVPGLVRLAVTHVEPPSETANPIWHVRATWTLGAGEGRSFTADLKGVIDWQAGRIRLAGPITSGWMSGTWVNQEGRIVDGDISGTLQLGTTTVAGGIAP